MLKIAGSQRRWLAVFGVTLVCLMGAALWLYLRLPSFRSPAFDFSAMAADETLVAHGLTRRQDGSLKLGFAESYPPPQIGAYGNHVINHWGSEAFGRPPDPAYFFNYAYANLALPEIDAYLVHLERLGHLPKRLAVVQITTPNNDNGAFIVNWGNELPPDIILELLSREGSIGEVVGLSWQLLRNELHEVLSYNTALLSLLQGGPANRIIGDAACRPAPPEWLLRLPFTLRSMVGPIAGRSFYCLPQNLWYRYQRDGSIPVPQPEAGAAGLVQNENPIRDSERALNAGDEARIARYLRDIDAIGRRNGIPVVFLVPPVYETDRRDTTVNQIFDRGLAMAPEVAVIDHRHLREDATLFQNYNHPSLRYYRLVVEELRRRGFIE